MSNVEQFRDSLTRRSKSLLRAAVVYVSIFATVAYFAFFSRWLTTWELGRVQAAAKEVPEAREQLQALRAAHRDSIPICKELVVQRDYYIDCVRLGLVRTGGNANNPDFVAYREMVETLLWYYQTSDSELEKWRLADFAKVENAIYAWKDLYSSAEQSQRAEDLTRLARAGAEPAGSAPRSQPAVVLASADNVLAIASILNQTMSNFDFAARPHYLAHFNSPGAPWLRAGKHLETLSDLKALARLYPKSGGVGEQFAEVGKEFGGRFSLVGVFRR